MEKINQISETMWEVLGKTVTLKTKAGRRIWTCSCQNHSRFCNENAYCYHKELVMNHIIKTPTINEIDRIIKQYEDFKNITKKMDINLILDDLKLLKKSIISLKN